MSSSPQFDFFFNKATSSPGEVRLPYDYQRRLAGGDAGRACESQLISVPTGLGKTAAVVLAWLWNRIAHGDESWPRRLVYCLPMRTLVEQTRDEVSRWIGNIETQAAKLGLSKIAHAQLTWLRIHSPIVLMGGEENDTAKRDWDIHPERTAIIIGTQDVLLSRALNRGYGMSRYRWPMHFGLLNNDALWLIDETQLMGSGLITTVQLDGFRQRLWMTERPCVSWWMSATLPSAAFNTTDRRELGVGAPTRFPDDAGALADVGVRLKAEKQPEVLGSRPKLSASNKSGILDQHSAGRITLVIVNTVDAALNLHREIAEELEKRQVGSRKKKISSVKPIPDLQLLHSRFRPGDRASILREISSFQRKQPCDGSPIPQHPGLVIVSTQVIEAGFDLSAAVLWTEIAPWSSMVQRLGRLNRDGHCPEAKAFFWMPKDDKKGENATESPNARRIGPYDRKAVETGRALIDELSKRVALGTRYRDALEQVQTLPQAVAALEIPIIHAIRPDDLHGLFSTEPDLAGGFTNIAHFVRDEDRNTDVFLYWREFKSTPPLDSAPAAREELVAVPFYGVQKFLAAQKKSAFRWDEDAEIWRRISAAEVVSGMTLLLPKSIGGYSSTIGWTGNPEHEPTLPESVPGIELNRLTDDRESYTRWESLTQHTDAVGRAVSQLFTETAVSSEIADSAALAVQWHDVGKAHTRWQAPLSAYAPDKIPAPWGKFCGVPNFRPGFRHEALSVLCAWAQWPGGKAGLTALALYLIGSHHGKLRTVLRSINNGEDIFGLNGTDAPLLLTDSADMPFEIDLSRKNFAGRGKIDWPSKSYIPDTPSWTAIVDELLGPAWRDDAITCNAVPLEEPRNLGPFRLAFIEAVFRAADGRASRGDFS